MPAVRPDILPVVLGGDTGAYALARQLHEATGQRVRLISPSPVQAIALSCYIDVINQGYADQTALMDTLRSLVDGRGPRSAVVIGNWDWAASFLARHRHELEPQYVVPFPSLEAMDALSDKVAFARACAEHGLTTPRQVVVRGSQLAAGDPEVGIDFPLIGKPAVGADWDALSFPPSARSTRSTLLTSCAGCGRTCARRGSPPPSSFRSVSRARMTRCAR